MGTLIYGHGAEIRFEDRALAHIRVVALAKLRRLESFSLTWKEDNGGVDQLRTIWISANIPLRFEIDFAAVEPLNRAWVDNLTVSASRGDMQLHSEPA